ncbi:MAG: hypothetical protein ACSHX0_10160 [Akkermansiaceae bacterium]
MKIITWHLDKLNADKIGPDAKASSRLDYFNTAGLGGNILSFITKVVSGDEAWSNLWTSGLTAAPADILVVIGVVSGGQAKGTTASGSSDIVLPILKAALSAATGKSYDYIPPLVTGYRECVGILYNTETLSYDKKSSGVLKKTTEDKGTFLLPRSPFWARLTDKASSKALNIIGIHAPPPKGKDDTEYQKPIQYCNSLNDVERVTQKELKSDQERTLVLGDFNCSPVASYKSTEEKGNEAKKVSHLPFTELFKTYDYGTKLPSVPPTPTPPPPKVKPENLTTLRKSLDTSKTPPASYLDRAHDNILYSHLGTISLSSKVLNLIGEARNMNQANTPPLDPTHSFTLAEYAKISSHLPVVLEF